MNTILKDLGGGLVLRRSTAADAEALAVFNSRIHSDDGPDKPDERVGVWTRDLLTRPHPTFAADDFTIVEETASGRIVSSMNLIPQTWTYAGIPFEVGRPEVVGTLPEFRNRGLVRLQFEEAHRRGAERGQVAQVITGIPYYYRQFGYEMGIELNGGRFLFQSQVERLKPDEGRPYRIRPAARADLAFMGDLYERAQRRYLVACQRTPATWAYELDGQSEKNVCRYELRIIEDGAGKPAGYLMHSWFLGQTGTMCVGYELTPGAPWLDVTPWVVKYLWEAGQEYARRDERACTSVGFIFGTEHPVYQVLGESMLPAGRPPYAFYIRVADLRGFLERIRPELEERLAASPAVGFSGELELNFYRDGMKLVFEAGRIKAIEPWQPAPDKWGKIGFPNLTFLQLVFGYRSLAELRRSYADCWCQDETTRLVLESLFPRRPSNILALA